MTRKLIVVDNNFKLDSLTKNTITVIGPSVWEEVDTLFLLVDSACVLVCGSYSIRLRLSYVLVLTCKMEVSIAELAIDIEFSWKWNVIID